MKIKKGLTKHIFHVILIELTAKHLNIAGWSSLVARRAHNPKVVWFKSRPSNHKKENSRSKDLLFSFLLSGVKYTFVTSPTSVARWVSKGKRIDNPFSFAVSLKARFFQGECTEPTEKEMRQGPGDVRTN